LAQRSEGAAAKKRNPVLEFVIERTGLLIPLASAVVFYIRCLAVSRGNLYTASILLSQSSIGDAIRALLLVTVPLALLIASIVAVLELGEDVIAGTARSRRTALLTLVSLLSLYAALFFMGLGYFGAGVLAGGYAIAMGAFLFVWYLLAARFNLRDVLPLGSVLKPLRALVGVAAAFAVWFVLFGDVFWLPRERLSFAHEEPITGYVLNTSDGYVVVLRDDPRVVFERPLGDLVDRRFCSLSEVLEKRIRDDFPLCP
jgi:hypothetical protein